MELVLKRDGFYSKKWVYDAVAGRGDWVTTPVGLDLGLFAFWSRGFEIDEGVVLGDLVTLLQAMPDAAMTTLEILTDCNIRSFLAGDTAVVPAALDESPVKAIEVYSYVELDNHDDPSQPFDFSCVVSCHGVGVDPDATPYAIDFTPWSKLLALPLRLQRNMHLCRSAWCAIEPEPWPIGTLHDDGSTTYSEPFGPRDRKLVNTTTEICTVGFYSMGEVLTALLTELCYFGTPSARDAKAAAVTASFEKVLNVRKGSD